MEAGFGAEEQASRRARRVERLRGEQAATGAVHSEVEAALERAQREQRNWSAGAEGERLVARALEPLARYGWTTLHDVHWPGRPLANIDHIAIGPGGVVVIDAKNWTGAVTLVDGGLRQNGYRRDREVEGVAAATASVTALLVPEHRSAAAGAICLAGQEQAPARSSAGVTVVGRLQLASYLAGLPPRLTPFDVADIGRHLTRQLAGPTSPRLVTTAALEAPRARLPRRTPRRVPARTGAQPFALRQPAGGRKSSVRRTPRGRSQRRSSGVVGPLVQAALFFGLAFVLLDNLDTVGPWLASYFAAHVIPTVP